MKRPKPYLLAVLLCSFWAATLLRAPAWGAQTPAPNVITINQGPPPAAALLKMRVEGDHVTAEIRDAPLQQVLEEVAAQTGVIFEISTHLNPPLSVTLYRVGVLEAIQRIVSGNNVLFYYINVSGESRISFVRIFPRGKKGEASLRYIGSGVPTKRAEDLVDTPEQALKALEQNENLVLRQKAVEVLAAAKGETAIKGLMKAMNDPAVEVKVAAIEGLSSLGVRSALPQILQALKDSHPGVRLSAVHAVAFLGDVRNVKDLQPMSRDKDGSVAAAAEVAIRKISERRHDSQ